VRRVSCWLVTGLLCGLFGPGPVAGTQLPNKLSGPIVGYVWSVTDHALHPIQGVLGNATIGAPLDAGFELTQALPLDERHFLGSTPDETSLVVISAATLPFTKSAVAGAPAKPSLAARSEKGSAAVLYYAAEQKIRIVTKLTSTPILAESIDVLPGLGEITRMAVSDDGRLVMYAASQPDQDVLYSWTSASSHRLVAILRRVSGIALLENSGTVVVDSKENAVYYFADPTRSAAKVLLADDRNGVSNPTSVAVVNGERIYVTNASARTVLVLTLSGQVLRSLPCNCEPAGLYPFSDSVYRLSERVDQTINLLKVGETGDRIVFVPAFPDDHQE
jgi:hypothetical protein